MNLVGAQGMGESVWLAWFLILVLGKMAALCETLGEAERAVRYRKKAEEYARASENAWDKDHFLRGYYGRRGAARVVGQPGV